MNSAKDALARESQLKQAPSNIFQRRKYSTSDKAHALVTKAAEELGRNKSQVIEILILDGLAESEPDAR